MAKIDVSKIEGYAEMSAEDKLKALEAYDVPDPDMSGFVSKEQFDMTFPLSTTFLRRMHLSSCSRVSPANSNLSVGLAMTCLLPVCNRKPRRSVLKRAYQQ